MKNFFKKLMSSKSQSKYFSETVQRVGKNNAGFSLVELIVVIAIMAILAAVAVIGVSIYIPKAQEATDNELMGVLTDALVAACLSEGVDQREITATIAVDQQTGKLAMNGTDIAIQISGTSKADEIADLFNDVVTDKNAKFNIIKNKSVKFVDGKFDWSDGTNSAVGGIYGEIFGAHDFSEQIGKVNGSTFGDIGAEGLLDRLDTVTNLGANLAGASPEFFNVLFNLDDLAKAMGFKNAEDEDFQTAFDEMCARKAQELGTDDTDVAMNHILSNFAVLQAAQNTNGNAETYLQGLQDGANISAIKDLMGSQDTTQSKEGLVQASMMYAMYTAYANSLPENDPDKAQALENAEDTGKLIDALDDPRFKEYLNTDQAKTDMEGYLAALDIINQSTKDNYDATADLIENGYKDDDLNVALGELLGK